MDSALIKFVVSQGIFAVLFCYLLMYVLKQNGVREDAYQKLVNNLVQTLPLIKEELGEIKDKLIQK